MQITKSEMRMIRDKLNAAPKELIKSIPPDTLEGIRNYVLEGIPVGDFLRHVFTNNLFGAMNHADNYNKRALPEIVCYIFCYCPAGCNSFSQLGKADIVNEWIQAIKHLRGE